MEFTVKFENENDVGLTGEVTIKFPTMSEKMELLDKLKSLGWSESQRPGEQQDLIKIAGMMGAILTERVKRIHLKHEATGTVIDSLDLLSLYAVGNQVTGIIGGWIMGGIPMGKLKSTN